MTTGDGIAIASVWAFAAAGLFVPGLWCVLGVLAACTVTGMVMRPEGWR